MIAALSHTIMDEDCITLKENGFPYKINNIYNTHQNSNTRSGPFVFSRKLTIWPDIDNYFREGLLNIIEDYFFYSSNDYNIFTEEVAFLNINQFSVIFFIDEKWQDHFKNKRLVLISDSRTEALANYWYYRSGVSAIVYADDDMGIIKDKIFNALNGRFLKKDLSKSILTEKEMTVLKLSLKGITPKMIARNENCSLKTAYAYRRRVEKKLSSRIRRINLSFLPEDEGLIS